jgi:hypothetical protein
MQITQQPSQLECRSTPYIVKGIFWLLCIKTGHAGLLKESHMRIISAIAIILISATLALG